MTGVLEKPGAGLYCNVMEFETAFRFALCLAKVVLAFHLLSNYERV